MKQRFFFFLVVLLCYRMPVWAQATLTGIVLSASGDPVPGATVAVKGSTVSTAAAADGRFALHTSLTGAVLAVSAVGYEEAEVRINGRTTLVITLQQKVAALDETVVIAYGTTTRRLSTGSVGRVTGTEISRQPVSNPLAALSGRVPGLLVTQSSGIAGSAFKVQVRGQNSLAQGSDPLFIIDGVPFAPGNSVTNLLTSAANVPGSAAQGGLSPFNTLNPADIESIEILKDADATAIYGSRGANGVVLITTKKGKAGVGRLSLILYAGFSRATPTTNLLNTAQYLQMRHEGFAQDGAEPDVFNAPDLTVWDTTRYTDFKDLLIGGTAHTTDAQVSYSGGTEGTQFGISGGYHRETSVFPGSLSDTKGSFRISLQHRPVGKRFSLQFTAGYTSESNRMLQQDLTSFINLPPNYPVLEDASGKLRWEEKGTTLNNPLAFTRYAYKAVSNNLVSSLQLAYQVLPQLVLRTSLGYNSYALNEHSKVPREAQNPLYNPLGLAQFGSSAQGSWIIEPQAEYSTTLARGQVRVLIGGTGQEQKGAATSLIGFGYTSDALLNSLTGAATTLATNESRVYRYAALFGRVNYNWQNRYLVNLSGRRDGSSRFGPNRRQASFGAVGAAWIFSNAHTITKNLHFLSFGKLRASYGTTGNDQIGDYQYLNSWSASPYAYGGQPGLYPSRLYNGNYSWEISRKWEGALDLGFLQDRFLVSVAFFRSRNGNQLISYSLPAQSGFNSVIQNFDALVENRGWEFSGTGRLVAVADWGWTITLNMTLPQNRLVSFPGLATSAYANTYVEGESLRVTKGYRFTGVDQSTGIYGFEDVNKDGRLNYKDDYQVLGSRDPRYYGGISNNLRWKACQLDFFLDYRRQQGLNYRASMQSSFIPGLPFNQPQLILNRWQRPGDTGPEQRFTAVPGSEAFIAAASYLATSDAVYSDASFIRLRNLSFSWQLPDRLLQRRRLQTARLFFQGQNLLTLTRYKGSDPETQNLYVLPPLKTLTAGLQLTF